MADAIQIGVLGEYDPKSPTLPTLEKSIQHATSELKIAANVTWLPTGGLLAANLDQKLKNFDGLWAAPGVLITVLMGCYAESNLRAGATGPS